MPQQLSGSVDSLQELSLLGSSSLNSIPSALAVRHSKAERPGFLDAAMHTGRPNRSKAQIIPKGNLGTQPNQQTQAFCCLETHESLTILLGSCDLAGTSSE